MEAEMRVPKLKDSLAWGERKKQKISSEDTHILSSSAMSNVNKFADDGSFLFKFIHPPKSNNSGDVVCDNSSNSKPEAIFNELRPLESKKGSEYDYDNTPRRKTRKSANEIRNFKKCLIMMLAKQEKDVVFLETVMGLAKQRRHCLVECIPLPKDVAKQAPLYFKKAIDEAEDEWSQHNAKKLIDTSIKGLRASIPKDFPYFHVEFGLNRGFVHVIEDEKGFKSSFGLNVVRGMLKLAAKDMHSHQKREFIAKQKQVLHEIGNLSIGQSNLTNSHGSSGITFLLSYHVPLLTRLGISCLLCVDFSIFSISFFHDLLFHILYPST
nr:CWF19-like protein 2 isoform X1 [Ipomoea trifida]